ncbi:MAG: type III-A CRISPR-associated RAMP protein Csm5 [bacterium]
MLTYKFQVEILTPIHIGSKDEIESYEYVIKNGKLFKINLADFLYQLSPAEQEEFDKFLSSNIVQLRQFIRNRAGFDKFAEFSIDVSKTVASIYETKLQDVHNQLIVAPFIRELSHPFIPGSSLKGAIRTAVIFELFQGKVDEKMKPDIFEAEVLKSERGFFDEKAQRFVTRGLDGGKDPFRAIKITDARLPENSTYVERVETFSKKTAKPLDIQLFKEVTYSSLQNKPIIFLAEFRFDDQLINRNKEIKLKSIDNDFIIKACNNFTRQIIKHELEYFKDPPTNKIYSHLQEESRNLNKDTFLLRIGWGSGFSSMTVNLKQERPKSIQTRKLIDGYLPLGWIKVTVKE